MKPQFIAVEGLEGAGKTTVIKLIQSFLEGKGLSSICTREPGGTPMSEAIRECVKQDWQEDVTQETELLLMYAARSQLVHNVIKPALTENKWVIGDRHDWSSIAYQGGGRQISLDKLRLLKDMTLGDFTPDFTLFLDVDPQVGLERARGRGELDRIEQSGISFFERARNSFIELVEQHDNARLIDANLSLVEVHESVNLHLNEWYDTLKKEQ